MSVLPPTARAGGAGVDIPPFPLPVRQTELRLATQAKMVCVADPQIECDAPFIDAPSTASNTDGGTLRSASCPGSPAGACRPAYIPGVELTGELVVDWPIVRSPVGGPFPAPDPNPGLSCDASSYKICHVNGLIELNVAAPGVSVSNPIIAVDSTSAEFGGTSNECRCIGPDEPEGWFAGEQIGRIGNDDDDWWFTRNVGASCDVALEYSEFIRRDLALIRAIAEEAFPETLCHGLGPAPCGSEALPIFVEPDGSLTKGCGNPPGNTFTIRFASPNEPRLFAEKPIADTTLPRSLGDVNGDGKLDLVGSSVGNVYLNDGSNSFTSLATGLSGVGPALIDWTDDGKLDLVSIETPGPLNRDVIVHPGDGTGGFSSASSFVMAAGLGRVNDQIEAEDFNDDGLPDAHWSSRVAYNQTSGSIAPPVDFVFFDRESLGVVDLDGDGRPDMLSGEFGSPVAVWNENDGPGLFSSQTLLTLPEPDELAPVIGQEALDYLECDAFGNDCCSLNRTAGCQDNACEVAVCAEDSSCCNSEWDTNCVDLAFEVCSVCIDPAKPDCCDNAAPKIGCEDASCAAVVCQQDPFCCGAWDEFCAEEAKRWCSACRDYDVVCREPEVRRATGSDVDGDGDMDLVLAIQVPQYIQHPRNLSRPRPTYLTWLPNRQTEDPVLAAGDPLFDPVLSPWRPIGPGASQVEMADVDGDGDEDIVSQIANQGFWYRNDAGGAFAGPYAIRGAVVSPSDPEDLDDQARVFVADLDDDDEIDVVVASSVFESLPEPGFGLGVALGVASLSVLRRNGRRT